MSNISIQSQNTSPVKQALSLALASAALSAQAAATGEKYASFSENPTDCAVGSAMRAERNTLKILSETALQVGQMTGVAESAMMEIKTLAGEMLSVLMKGSAAYMTDTLLNRTLTPIYIQLQAHINDIANFTQFIDQTILNAQGGIENTLGTAATVAATPTYKFTGLDSLTLDQYAPNATIINGLSAAVNGTTSSALTIKASDLSQISVVSGEAIQINGNIEIPNAVVRVTNANITNAATPTALTGTGTVTINAKLTFPVTSANYDATTGKVTLSAQTAMNLGSPTVSFSELTSGITSIDTVTGTPTLDTTAGAISNVTPQYQTSGGVPAIATYQCITNSSLQKVSFAYPNLVLNDALDATGQTVQGAIATLNIADSTSSTQVNNLSALATISDITRDLPLVMGYITKVETALGLNASYMQRIDLIAASLDLNAVSTDKAQGVFLDANLADATETFVKSTAQTQIAITMLGQLYKQYASLAQLVQSAV